MKHPFPKIIFHYIFAKYVKHALLEIWTLFWWAPVDCAWMPENLKRP